MARSPSPTGSSYSKRSRHDDHDRRRDDRREREREKERDRDRDRDRRDDRRRRRSRSRSPGRYDRRYRDDSRDRHYNRRDRSRNRNSRRPRDVRDERRRSPDRYSRRDDSRERDRKRRDDSADSRRERRRPDSRERRPSKADKSATPPAPAPVPAQTAEQKQAERLARLEEWKKKQLAAAAEKKPDVPTPMSTRGLLDDMDKKATSAASPASASPQSPASPAPYAGKFDPKAIVKKATANSAAANKLGLDVEIPSGTAIPKPPAPEKATRSLPKAPASSVKQTGKLGGFGLGAKTNGVQKASSGLDFGEEEGEKRKLEKLPNSALENEDATLANGAQDEGEDGADDDDGDVDMQDGTEEEAAAAARAAAEKREERLHAQNVAYQEGDATMQDAEPAQPDPNQEEEEAEEEVDPLDAFMADLGSSAPSSRLKVKSKRVQEPVAMFGDDETMDAVADDENTDDIMAMAASKRKKKDIPKVDHAKVGYESFRRNFYHEPSELSGMSEEELADLRLELDGIKVRGVDVPKPVVSWAQCGMGVQTLDVIAKLNYEKPSSIQSQAIPAIMSGRDVIGVAKTGSGKTVAFLLPMFRHIKDQRPLDNLEGPVGVIMTPTRELATQIHRDCKPFLKALNLGAVCAYGGAPIKDQIAELKRGAEIVVCTPGRMIDLLAANAGRVTNLKRVTYCVLDEADRMFDMGFEPQVMKILGNIRPDRQTVLFSATFPRQMEALARKTLNKPVEIIVGGRSVVAPEITQLIEVRPEETKFLRLLELLGELYEDDVASADYRALVFVERQESADGLLRDLMRKGYPCMSIHGGKDQIDRDSTIHDFKAGVVPILIATSVAARGLDVKQLKLVVNFDAPNHLEDYVHRAGRTGRAGNTGTAVTFITPDQDRYSLDLAKALTQSDQPVPEPLQALVDTFKDKVKAGKEKAAGSGFGGRGLERLDQDRDATRNAQRKAYKTGEEGEDDEKEEGGKSTSKTDDLIAKAASGVQAAGSSSNNNAANNQQQASSGSGSAGRPLAGVPAGIDLDGKITVHKTETPEPSANGGAGGNTGAASNDPMERVRAVAGKLNSKVGGGTNSPAVGAGASVGGGGTGAGVSSGAPLDNKGPDAGAYHSTLEINDFPQKARWAVTNRTNVAKILEATGTSITTKGNFYAAGKEPTQGEQPKLYILVEGDTEIVVTNAMRELMRLLKQGTIAAAEGEARAPTGRYNVV